jgi:hypothetical protein
LYEKSDVFSRFPRGAVEQRLNGDDVTGDPFDQNVMADEMGEITGIPI